MGDEDISLTGINQLKVEQRVTPAQSPAKCLVLKHVVCSLLTLLQMFLCVSRYELFHPRRLGTALMETQKNAIEEREKREKAARPPLTVLREDSHGNLPLKQVSVKESPSNESEFWS